MVFSLPGMRCYKLFVLHFGPVQEGIPALGQDAENPGSFAHHPGFHLPSLLDILYHFVH